MSPSAATVASVRRPWLAVAGLAFGLACGEAGDGGQALDAARETDDRGTAAGGTDSDGQAGGFAGTLADGGPLAGTQAVDAGAGDGSPAGGARTDGGPAPDAGAGGAEPDAQVGPPVFGTCGAVLDLLATAQPAPAGWRIEATSARAAQTEVGSCGGDGRELAYAFTAPGPGAYTFAAAPAEAGGAGGVPFRPAVYLRRNCEDPTSELACAEPGAGAEGGPAVVTRLLAADESVLVFVDAVDAFIGGPFVLDVTVDPPGAPGEACEPDGDPNACAPELRCLPVDGDARCRVVGAPAVTSARLVVEPEAGTLGLRLEGQDPGDDVTGLVLEAVDAAGAPVSLGPRPPGGVRAFTAITRAAGAFDGAFALRTERGVGASPVADIAAVTVEVVDAAGLRSAPLRVEPSALRRPGPGEICDPDRIFDACVDGLLCDDGICGPPGVDCPEAFAPAALRPGLTLAGDTLRARDVADAPCGGAGGDAVYQLTAESAGFYVVEAWSADPDVRPLVFARTACGAEDPGASLGCEAPRRGERAQLCFDLAAGETVSAFVTALDVDSGGAFSVRVLRPEAPVIDSAEVFVNPEAQALGLRVVGHDPDGDVRAVGVRLFDEDGADLLGDGLPADLRLVAGESTLRPGGEVAVRASRRLALDGAAIALVEVSLVDAFGARSASLAVAALPTPPAARGALCDVDGAFFACVAPDRCGGPLPRVPDPEGICVEAFADCPPELGDVIDLDDPVYSIADGLWQFDGDTGPGGNDTAGTCGGAMAPEDVLAFRAPVAGVYVFRTTLPQGGDTVLYVRSNCGDETPEAELGCNDDGPDAVDFGSRVVVALEGGQTVYAFVDGFGNAGNPYTLTVEVQR